MAPTEVAKRGNDIGISDKLFYYEMRKVLDKGVG